VCDYKIYLKIFLIIGAIFIKRKILFFIIILFFGLFIAGSASATNITQSKTNITISKQNDALLNSSWSKSRHDNQNTGLSIYSGPSTNHLAWKYKTGNVVYSSPAVDRNGNIYFGSQDEYFYALTSNGKLKWKYKTGGWIYSSPAIDKYGRIYFGSFDKYLYAFNSSGKLNWKYKTDGWVWSSPAIADNGMIYVGSADNYLYAIKPDGTLKWKYKTKFTVLSSPAIDKNGNIYFGSQDSYLYALTPNGELKWKFETDDWVDSSPVIANDSIYIASDDDNLYALTADGKLKWKFTAGNDVFSAIAVDRYGNIYIGANNNFIYALNSMGKLRWKYNIGTYVSAPVVDRNGNIYFGSFDHYLYSFTSNGTLRWKYKTGDWIVGAPSISCDGTLYIGSEDNYFYAIRDNNIKTPISYSKQLNNLNISQSNIFYSAKPLNTNNQDSSNQSNGGCCSVVVHVSNGHDVVAFRRDSTEAADIYIIKERWYGKNAIKEYKTSGEYFVHNIITENGWIMGAGGGGINREIEKLAGEIMLRGTISMKDLQRADTLLTKQTFGHFYIKAPSNTIGVTIARGRDRISKIFTMTDGSYICAPNKPSLYHQGNYTTYKNDPVKAAIYIAGTDPYGVTRRNIITYDLNNNINTTNIHAYASFDGGILIKRLKGSPDNVFFLGKEYLAKSLPDIPDRLSIGEITFNKSADEINPFGKEASMGMGSSIDQISNDNINMSKENVDPNNTIVNAQTIPMQKTGTPLVLAGFAILLMGLGVINRKK
jgi:outer membrane protein assembly factor BamB